MCLVHYTWGTLEKHCPAGDRRQKPIVCPTKYPGTSCGTGHRLLWPVCMLFLCVGNRRQKPIVYPAAKEHAVGRAIGLRGPSVGTAIQSDDTNRSSAVRVLENELRRELHNPRIAERSDLPERGGRAHGRARIIGPD